MKDLEDKKMADTLTNMLVLLQLLSESEKLREAAVHKGLVLELFKLLPLLLSNLQSIPNTFDLKLHMSAFFLFDNINA